VQQFLIPLFQHHAPSVVEFFLYSSVDRPDFATEQYRAIAGDRFRDIRRMDDESAAELVRRDRIDILVDLALHGAGNRLLLFARKPAPVQMTWVGYAGTTGLDMINYRITDPYFDPPGTDLGLYAETSLRLPESYWCYDSLERDLPVGPLPAGTAGFITFGCLNSPRKIHAGVLSLWARVLHAVPGSRLFVYIDEHAQEAVRRTIEAAGVRPERVDFGGRVSRRAYLERYHRIDIVLDTFPFAGGTTSLDAIWMGVPFVTLSGEPTLQRAGVSIAMNLGLPELVATSEEEFVVKSVELSRDVERLSRLRGELRQRLEASPFGDMPGFARNLEAVYRTAWRRYCASVPGTGLEPVREGRADGSK
jgi:predicted O-linked N-acetylglucosamine transferase (SPINDLY family)